MRIRKRRGAAAIEFALCLPVLTLVLGGSVDFGRVVSTHHTLQRVARDAARVGGAITTDSDNYAAEAADIEAGALAYANAALATMFPSCGTDCTSDATWFEDDDGNAYLTVTVTAPFTAIFGVVPGLPDQMGDSFTVMTELQS